MFRALWHFIAPEYLHAHYGTVRYAFPVVFAASFIIGIAAIIASNQTSVVITTDVQNVARDQIFFIDVSVSAHVPINAVDLQIAYPDDKIKVEGIDTGESVITLWTEDPYAKDGIVYLRGGTFRKGFVGEHTIARIRAQALEAGEARLFVRAQNLIAGDGKGTPVMATEDEGAQSVRITVAGEEGTIVGDAAITILTDTNGDGRVDVSDITLFMSAWLTQNLVYDFNNDGRMTFRDFSILLADAFLR